MKSAQVNTIKVLILFWVNIHFIVLSAPNGADSFGEYDVCVEVLKLCRGIKKENLTSSSIDIKYGGDGGGVFLTVNVTLLENSGPFMQKTKVMKWNGKRFESMLTYATKSACENELIRKMIYEKFATFVTTDSTCIVKKSTRVIENFDATSYLRVLFGEKFFYGRFKVSVQNYTPKGNILCMDSIFSIVKKGTCKMITL